MGTQIRADISSGRLLIVALLLVPMMSISFSSQVAWGAKKKKPLPEFSTVAAAVKRHFETVPDFEPGDLIAEADVGPVFDQLQLMGWRIADRKAIEGLLPNESNFVTRQLRSKQGVKFMRKISSDPDGYERLYQLASLPNGNRLARDLIHGKGGHEMIDYMTTSKGGKNLTKMLAKTPHGKQIGKRSELIFTVDQLIARLKESYAAEKKARAEAENDK